MRHSRHFQITVNISHVKRSCKVLRTLLNQIMQKSEGRIKKLKIRLNETSLDKATFVSPGKRCSSFLRKLARPRSQRDQYPYGTAMISYHANRSRKRNLCHAFFSAFVISLPRSHVTVLSVKRTIRYYIT